MNNNLLILAKELFLYFYYFFLWVFLFILIYSLGGKNKHVQKLHFSFYHKLCFILHHLTLRYLRAQFPPPPPPLLCASIDMKSANIPGLCTNFCTLAVSLFSFLTFSLSLSHFLSLSLSLLLSLSLEENVGCLTFDHFCQA